MARKTGNPPGRPRKDGRPAGSAYVKTGAPRGRPRKDGRPAGSVKAWGDIVAVQPGDIALKDINLPEGDPRAAAYAAARKNLIAFTMVTMPDPVRPNELVSLYDPALHHEAIATLIHNMIFKREYDRAVISMPPRCGKSELVSRRLPAFFLGNFPQRDVIFATYSQDFADEFGKKTREIMRSPEYQIIFPDTVLKTDTQAANNLMTTLGGNAYFVGAGGPITGRGAHLLVIDDPIKNSEDARSEAKRKGLWEWYTSTVLTRLMPGGVLVIVMTRWNEDDLAGRTENPAHTPPEEAAKYKRLVLPAILPNGEALWPQRFPLDKLMSIKRQVGPDVWQSLYMQSPAPDDGDYFKTQWFVEYSEAELPANLRYYAASDHAVGTKRANNRTCMGMFGVDEHDTIWLLPDLTMKRMDTFQQVEQMLDYIEKFKPLTWWAEKGHITGSIGPFLRKRMEEKKLYCHIEEIPANKDKMSVGRSIQARMSMRKVRFPRHAGWYADARGQLLKFPYAPNNDDFVSFFSMIGLGLSKMVGAEIPDTKPDEGPRVGTIGWVKYAHNIERAQSELDKAIAGR
jgi:hypothetical protein